MRIILIRHALTSGNLEKRYIGSTDEELCDTGINALKNKSFPDCDIVFSSPMKRCRQTARLIYPDKKIITVSGFAECDFGDFEGKNYSELNGRADYQAWIDSGGLSDFPGGESPLSFRKRSVGAFEQAVSNYDFETAAFVVHGGTIMSIMEKFAEPKGNFYDFQVSNACGFVCEMKNNKLVVSERI